MKFDPTRAESLFRELGEPRYAGPDGDAQVAGLVASQFEGMGLHAERREVAGSRFPRWVASWLGWPGYGLLVTSVYGLIVQENNLPAIFGLVVSLFGMAWIHAVIFDASRFGRRRKSLESAPVVIGTLRDRPASPARVVFHVRIPGVRLDPFPFPFKGYSSRFAACAFLYLFPFLWAAVTLILRVNLSGDPGNMRLGIFYGILTRLLYPALLAALWGGILVALSRHYRRWRASAGRIPPDRRGLAALLEIARGWPRRGSQAIEPVFVASGGRGVDDAGPREVVRLVETEWSSSPSLVIAFLAPGAGDGLRVYTVSSRGSRLSRLAQDSAQSLWIPCEQDEDFGHPMLAAYRDPTIALMGSDPGAFDDDSVDPQVLHRAAQLATEIALRWAKNPRATGIPESAG